MVSLYAVYTTSSDTQTLSVRQHGSWMTAQPMTLNGSLD